MTEGLPVNLVRTALKRVRGDVLDPFVGCGTVILEANKAGLSALGFDVNPFMCFVTSVKNHFHEIQPRDIEGFLQRTTIEPVRLSEARPAQTLRTYYTPESMRRLFGLERAVASVRDSREKDLLKLAFAKTALRQGNLRMTPAPRLYKGRKRLSILRSFREIVAQMLADVRDESPPKGQVEVLQADSQILEVPRDQKFSLVLSSPPYCNNIDFVRHSQLPLYWLGFCQNAGDLRKIRSASLTSCEAMAYSDKIDKPMDQEVERLVSRLMKVSNRGYYRVVSQYFSGMESHASSLRDAVRRNGRLIYVIGDSWLQGVYVPTHRILGRIVKHAGFRSVRIRWIRYRKSGRQHSHTLSEYIVSAMR